jgi:hypothetical protein
LALGLLSGQAFICSFLAIWSDASQAFTSQIDPMGVVNETVEDRISVGWVVDDLMPTVHGELGCDDGRAAAVSLFEDFQDIVTSGGVEWLQSPIVENEKVGAAERAQEARMTAIAARQGELFEELWNAVIEHRAERKQAATLATVW